MEISSRQGLQQLIDAAIRMARHTTEPSVSQPDPQPICPEIVGPIAAVLLQQGLSRPDIRNVLLESAKE